MQFGLALGLVGVDSANVLLGLHLVAAFHHDVLEVGVHREVFAVADDDHRVGAGQLGDAGHLAVEDGTGFGAIRSGDVYAVVGHRDLARHRGGVFAV